MKWFRFWTDAVNDVKMLQLSDYEYRMWTYLLAYASETDSLSGHFQITFKLLSLHFHQRFNLFSRAIETFQKVGLITIDDGGYITITNWNKRQFKSDNAYERVKKHREVTLKRNVSVTAPDTDTDTDTDKPPISPKKRGTKKIEFSLPEWIKKETWDAYREMRQRKRAPLTDRAAVLTVRELEKLKGQGENPEDVLNQSIMKSWTGVFPLSRGGNGNDRSGNFGSSGAPFKKTAGTYGRSAINPEGNRIPEWRSEDLPLITEADRIKNIDRAKQIAETIGKGGIFKGDL